MDYAVARKLARALALLTPLVLLGGAYVSQYGYGLYPCEMCWWQRYAHFAALALAIGAWLRPWGWRLTALAGMAIALSAAIGLFHAGVEYHWWRGFTECTSYVAKSGNPLDAIMNAPLIRCDVAQWQFAGVSLAGWNFLISAASALGIALLLNAPGKQAP
jgi:disulfide bond formation protein DsbB